MKKESKPIKFKTIMKNKKLKDFEIEIVEDESIEDK